MKYVIYSSKISSTVYLPVCLFVHEEKYMHLITIKVEVISKTKSIVKPNMQVDFLNKFVSDILHNIIYTCNIYHIHLHRTSYKSVILYTRITFYPILHPPFPSENGRGKVRS